MNKSCTFGTLGSIVEPWFTDSSDGSIECDIVMGFDSTFKSYRYVSIALGFSSDLSVWRPD